MPGRVNADAPVRGLVWESAEVGSRITLRSSSAIVVSVSIDLLRRVLSIEEAIVRAKTLSSGGEV